MTIRIKLDQIGNILKYPYSYYDLIMDNPNTSFPTDLPEATWEEFGVYMVTATDRPQYNVLTQNCIEDTPQILNGTWMQTWTIQDKTQEEIAVSLASLQTYITSRVQKRLDDFAKTRNYDGVLSACTYIQSTVDKFRIEAQYTMDARDKTWSTLYWVLNEVNLGNISIPTTYEEVEVYLPELYWPILGTSTNTISVE